MEPLLGSSLQKDVILATFRLRLYASQIQRVQNYVFAEVINKKTLHNHLFAKGCNRKCVIVESLLRGARGAGGGRVCAGAGAGGAQELESGTSAGAGVWVQELVAEIRDYGAFVRELNAEIRDSCHF